MVKTRAVAKIIMIFVTDGDLAIQNAVAMKKKPAWVTERAREALGATGAHAD